MKILTTECSECGIALGFFRFYSASGVLRLPIVIWAISASLTQALEIKTILISLTMMMDMAIM